MPLPTEAHSTWQTVRIGDDFGDVDDAPQVGPRGGRRVPVAIVWRPNGTGLFRLVNQEGKTALFPFVKWHNGSRPIHRRPTYRYTPVREWLKGTA